MLNRLTNLPQQNTTALGTRTYTAQGRPLAASWTNGTLSANQSSWSFDAAGRLAGMAIDLNGTASDVNWSFATNPAGQLVSETGSNNAYAFGDFVPFTLDYTVNGLNQYSAVGVTAYAYDTNGNLTTDGTKTYAYDTENRMVSAVSAAGTVGLRYDPLGRLYEVTDTNGSQRRLYYDGADLVLEYSGTGTLLRRFVHGASAGDDALLWYEGSTVSNATRRHLHADRLGSIVAVTDYQGNLLAANAYDEFGVPDQNNLGRFQYTGQAWVPELGMFYYKARMYSPTLGRFMQTDPIGYGDGMNMYAYVGNDPVNGVDPTGLACVTIVPHDGGPPTTECDGWRSVFTQEDFCNALDALMGCSSNGPQLFDPSGLDDGPETTPQSDPCSSNLQPVVLVPEGDTVGGDPERSGRRYVTDLRGGAAEAMALFTALSRLNNQAYVDSPGLGDMFQGGVFDSTLAISYNPHTGERGAVRLRYGPDFRNPGQGQFKVDIARGANPNLDAAETVHFRSSSRNRSPMCPTT